MEVKIRPNNIEEHLHHKSEDSSKHFSTPEGYFEGLTAQIMERIPDEGPTQIDMEQKVSWWTKAKPSLYLAASFVGLLLCFKGLTLVKEQNTPAPQQAKTEVKDDEYLRYYEDYASRLVGNEDERQLDAEQYM